MYPTISTSGTHTKTAARLYGLWANEAINFIFAILFSQPSYGNSWFSIKIQRGLVSKFQYMKFENIASFFFKLNYSQLRVLIF